MSNRLFYSIILMTISFIFAMTMNIIFISKINDLSKGDLNLDGRVDVLDASIMGKNLSK